LSFKNDLIVVELRMSFMCFKWNMLVKIMLHFIVYITQECSTYNLRYICTVTNHRIFSHAFIFKNLINWKIMSQFALIWWHSPGCQFAILTYD
jgi:hypothetical protein